MPQQPRPPWYAEAVRLQQQGTSYLHISRIMGVPESTLHYQLTDGYRTRKKVTPTSREVTKRWREKVKVQYGMSYWRLLRLRKEAREEALETNTPIIEVYKRWKIKLPKDTWGQ